MAPSRPSTIRINFEPETYLGWPSLVPDMLEDCLRRLAPTPDNPSSGTEIGSRSAGSLLVGSAYVECVLAQQFSKALDFTLNAGNALQRKPYLTEVLTNRFLRLPVKDRLLELTTLNEISLDLGVRPWQDVLFMFRLRNMVAHGQVDLEERIPLDLNLAATGFHLDEELHGDWQLLFDALTKAVLKGDLVAVETAIEAECAKFFTLDSSRPLSWHRILSRGCAAWITETCISCAKEIRGWSPGRQNQTSS